MALCIDRIYSKLTHLQNCFLTLHQVSSKAFNCISHSPINPSSFTSVLAHTHTHFTLSISSAHVLPLSIFALKVSHDSVWLTDGWISWLIGTVVVKEREKRKKFLMDHEGYLLLFCLPIHWLFSTQNNDFCNYIKALH